MVRVVKNVAKDLDEQQIGRLWDMVKLARDSNDQFFASCRYGADLASIGALNELQELEEGDQIIANLAHSHLKTKRPNVFFKEPTANCIPTHPKYENKAPTWSKVLNNTIRKIGLKAEARKGVTDSIVYPEGWLKVGLNRVIDPADTQPENAKNPNTGPTSEMSGGKGPVTWGELGSPVVSRVSPLQVIPDYMSEDRSLEKARFVDILYIKTVKEFELDNRYEKIEGLDKRTEAHDEDKHVITQSEYPNFFPDVLNKHHLDDLMVIHEIWVYQIPELNLYKQVVVLAEAADGLLAKSIVRKNKEGNIPTWTDILGVACDTYPLARLVFNEVPEKKPRSDMALLSSLQAGINWTMSRIVASVDSSKQLFTIKSSAVKDLDATIKLFNSGQHRTLIPVTEDNAILPVPNHQSPRDESILMNLVLEMMRRVTGISENKLGGDKFRTATAAAAADRSDQIKLTDEQDQVSEWLREVVTLIAKMILSLSKEAGNTQFVMNVGGETGSVEWIYWSPEDLNWLPDIHIEIDSYLKPTKDEQAQKGLMAMQALMQAIPAGVSGRVDILLKQVFEALEVKDIGKILDNSQDHVILQAVELALLLGGVQVPVNPDDNHIIHMRIIDQFLNAPESQQIQVSDPEGWIAVLQHRDQHEQYLNQTLDTRAQNSGISNTDSPFDGRGQASYTPANIARADTAREREASGIARLPGGGGQF